MPLFQRLVEADELPAHRRQVPIISPLSGKVVLLDKVPDSIIAQRLFGEGVAIEPSGYQLVSPFDGKISLLPTTCQQIRLTSIQGIQLLIQLGIGSEHMLGEGFKARKKAGQIINQGEVLIEFDLRKMKRLLPSTICPVTVLNSDKANGVLPHCHKARAGEDKIMTLLI